ncbi:hypothetical protein BTVI_18706 [Pitangus sulphuratus]|nr:hypothetical protein BTVI_18706 [Pitangus sulphuratus]
MQFIGSGTSVAQICRNGIRKTTTQLELNLARDAKNKTHFYKYVGQKRKIEENMLILINKIERTSDDQHGEDSKLQKNSCLPSEAHPSLNMPTVKGPSDQIDGYHCPTILEAESMQVNMTNPFVPTAQVTLAKLQNICTFYSFLSIQEKQFVIRAYDILEGETVDMKGAYYGTGHGGRIGSEAGNPRNVIIEP